MWPEYRLLVVAGPYTVTRALPAPQVCAGAPTLNATVMPWTSRCSARSRVIASNGIGVSGIGGLGAEAAQDGSQGAHGRIGIDAESVRK